MNHQYNVNIDNFQGPLDLLLHLIKEKNINILEINLLEVCNQYLQFIVEAKKINLNIASDYLFMASYLLAIKSKILLPKEIVTIETEEYLEDQQQKLITRLLEYQQIKSSTNFLKQQEQIRKQLLTKKPEQIILYQNSNLPTTNWNFDLNQLSEQLLKVYQSEQKTKPLMSKFSSQKVSPQIRAKVILNLLKCHFGQKMTLVDIFKYDEEISYTLMIVSFVAILDLTFKQKITIEQKNYLDPIYLTYRGDENE